MKRSNILAALMAITGLSTFAEAITAPLSPDKVATLPIRYIKGNNPGKQLYNGLGHVLVVPNRLLNQKQYRKLVKSNPSMFKSKKHRSKN